MRVCNMCASRTSPTGIYVTFDYFAHHNGIISVTRGRSPAHLTIPLAYACTLARTYPALLVTLYLKCVDFIQITFLVRDFHPPATKTTPGTHHEMSKLCAE